MAITTKLVPRKFAPSYCRIDENESTYNKVDLQPALELVHVSSCNNWEIDVE